ncbi:c-type cytochrome [Maritimibacter sp. DP07]|uniref:C-type cytochrome n=1 Tax=Maritimibacter harenae TaxID=2606218 RepID=A0A845M567_9RHOB|nr:cytochrome c [Maritimibacter harenae]MZR15185.1 c-type cytochrome [Maritimibacter harenae]
MKKFVILAIAAIVIAGGAYLATRSDQSADVAKIPDPAQGEPMVRVTVPETLSPQAKIGETAFTAICADCHGENAAGKMGYGPPLVHKIYEPSHHGDMAFQLAVQRGVVSHHWRFGNMPPQDGLTQGDVKSIVAYVRELQRANGIE